MLVDDHPTGFSTNRKRDILAEAQNWRCAYCSVVVNCVDLQVHDSITIDEVVARAHGGFRRWSNQVVACWLCNSGRGAMDADEYFALVQEHGRSRAAALAGRTNGARRRAHAVIAAVARSHQQELFAPQFGIWRGRAKADFYSNFNGHGGEHGQAQAQ